MLQLAALFRGGRLVPMSTTTAGTTATARIGDGANASRGCDLDREVESPGIHTANDPGPDTQPNAPVFGERCEYVEKNAHEGGAPGVEKTVCSDEANDREDQLRIWRKVGASLPARLISFPSHLLGTSAMDVVQVPVPYGRA